MTNNKPELHVVSFSGGKDSTAMLLRMLEEGMRVDLILFCDTGMDVSQNYIFTSESVMSGHPDKICDYIADSILDEALTQDKDCKMAVEATIKNKQVIVYGEANTKAKLDYAEIAKGAIREIGYDEIYEVTVIVDEQSPEINQAVTRNDETAAGDQGIMFGYATNETEEFMPAPIYFAHKLSRAIDDYRKQAEHTILKPDGKTQVSVEYVDNKPVRIDTIVVSVSHDPDYSQEAVKVFVEKIIEDTIDKKWIDENTKILINPSGAFSVYGPWSDSGTTGRKIVCDSYGGMGRIGGGCFSSKDPSKVDRSAAYYARYVAKNLVAHHLADRIEIQVAYAIGKKEPVSVLFETFGTEKVPLEEIARVIEDNFDFTVDNIIEELDLKKPIYRKTTNYGHFGDPEMPWEKMKDLYILLKI